MTIPKGIHFLFFLIFGCGLYLIMMRLKMIVLLQFTYIYFHMKAFMGKNCILLYNQQICSCWKKMRKEMGHLCYDLKKGKKEKRKTVMSLMKGWHLLRKWTEAE